MSRRKRRLPSPALVISCIALAFSLTGVGYATIVLPANSVGTKHLKENAVVGAKVKADSIRGSDIAESSLGTVPSATSADFLDGLDSTGLQKRVTGTCEGGVLQSVNEDGTVTCGVLGSVLPEGCAEGQVAKYGAGTWACANDVDTDTNSGGDITDVVAGNGLTGGASSGGATVDVAGGTGITVSPNSIGLDTSFTDGRYLRTSDVFYSCPAGYFRYAHLCWQNIDASGKTYPQAAVYCAQQGGRLPTYAELLAVGKSGLSIGNGGISGDWASDKAGDNLSVFINSTISTSDDWDGVRADSTTSGFARCVIPVKVVGVTGS